MHQQAQVYYNVGQRGTLLMHYKPCARLPATDISLGKLDGEFGILIIIIIFAILRLNIDLPIDESIVLASRSSGRHLDTQTLKNSFMHIAPKKLRYFGEIFMTKATF